MRALFLHADPSMRRRYEAALGIPVTFVNKGAFSASYDETRGLAHECPTLDAAVRRYMMGVGDDEPIVLLAFSAGCWAARAWLRDEIARRRCPAVVLIDGLHSGLLPNGSASETSLAGVIDYALEAAERRKVLVLTHSQIRTDKTERPYAATRQTADVVLRAAGAARGNYSDSVHAGGLHVLAGAGGDAEAHRRQLQQVGPDACRGYVAPAIGTLEHDTEPTLEAATVLVLPEVVIKSRPPPVAIEVGDDPTIGFRQAKNYTKGPRTEIKWIVIHTAECGEVDDAAERLASWAAGSQAPKASWHYAVDSNSIIQSVRERDIAWHAPGANKFGIGIEHAGRASQQAGQWGDPYSRAVLERSADLVSKLCGRWGIPVQRVGKDELIAGVPGITGHVDVSRAFQKSTHTDPGRAFPWELYLELVQTAYARREGDTA